MKKRTTTVRTFAHSLSVVVGLVLVWRGVWFILDSIDHAFFGGSCIMTALGGMVTGLLILYPPDRDLKELENLEHVLCT